MRPHLPSVAFMAPGLKKFEFVSMLSPEAGGCAAEGSLTYFIRSALLHFQRPLSGGLSAVARDSRLAFPSRWRAVALAVPNCIDFREFPFPAGNALR
jgi:hypothetical protein